MFEIEKLKENKFLLFLVILLIILAIIYYKNKNENEKMSLFHRICDVGEPFCFRTNLKDSNGIKTLTPITNKVNMNVYILNLNNTNPDGSLDTFDIRDKKTIIKIYEKIKYIYNSIKEKIVNNSIIILQFYGNVKILELKNNTYNVIDILPLLSICAFYVYNNKLYALFDGYMLYGARIKLKTIKTWAGVKTFYEPLNFFSVEENNLATFIQLSQQDNIVGYAYDNSNNPTKLRINLKYPNNEIKKKNFNLIPI